MPILADEALVASAFSKAAIYVYSADFIHDPVTQAFTSDELQILGANRVALNAMIQDALGGRQSVGAARLTAHFKSEENIPHLRFRLLEPGTPYGWEGPDYSDEEAYLTDNQFVYHSVYLEAIEATSERPIHEAIQPTGQEIRELYRLLENPSDQQYYWAKWLSRKLLLLPSSE